MIDASQVDQPLSAGDNRRTSSGDYNGREQSTVTILADMEAQAETPPAAASLQQRAKDSLADPDGTLLFHVLRELCTNNIEYFSKDDSLNGAKLHSSFQALVLHIELAKKRVAEIQLFAHEYDFDEHTPGNGYRSFIVVVDCCIKHSIKLCRNILENRSSLLFRKSMYFKEVSGRFPFSFRNDNCMCFRWSPAAIC